MTARKMLPANEAVLRTRFPAVLRKIIEAGDRMPDSFNYSLENGVERLMLQRGDYSFCPYGDKNPGMLIKRWFDNLNLAGESLYGITGFGDGSHLKYFLQESGTGTTFSSGKRPASSSGKPCPLRPVGFAWSSTISARTGELDDDYFASIQGAALTGVNDVNSIVFSPLHSVDEAYYDKMRNELVRQYLVIRPLMEVNVRTAINLQENTFQNLPHMAQAPDVGEMKGEFPDIPFVLVGAGPSLDESIEFLKSVQDKAIIISSNSPYRKLINSGFAHTWSLRPTPCRRLWLVLKRQLEDVFWLVRLVPTRKSYGFSDAFFLGTNPIVDLVKQHMGLPTGTTIMEQGTVSDGFDLSRLLGCRKVLFVGQDMSVRDDGLTTRTTLPTPTAELISPMRKKPPATQEKVLVEQRLFVYLKTEQFIAKRIHHRI